MAVELPAYCFLDHGAALFMAQAPPASYAGTEEASGPTECKFEIASRLARRQKESERIVFMVTDWAPLKVPGDGLTMAPFVEHCLNDGTLEVLLPDCLKGASLLTDEHRMEAQSRRITQDTLNTIDAFLVWRKLVENDTVFLFCYSDEVFVFVKTTHPEVHVCRVQDFDTCLHNWAQNVRHAMTAFDFRNLVLEAVQKSKEAVKANAGQAEDDRAGEDVIPEPPQQAPPVPGLTGMGLGPPQQAPPVPEMRQVGTIEAAQALQRAAAAMHDSLTPPKQGVNLAAPDFRGPPYFKCHRERPAVVDSVSSALIDATALVGEAQAMLLPFERFCGSQLLRDIKVFLCSANGACIEQIIHYLQQIGGATSVGNLVGGFLDQFLQEQNVKASSDDEAVESFVQFLMKDPAIEIPTSASRAVARWRVQLASPSGVSWASVEDALSADIVSFLCERHRASIPELYAVFQSRFVTLAKPGDERKQFESFVAMKNRQLALYSDRGALWARIART